MVVLYLVGNSIIICDVVLWVGVLLVIVLRVLNNSVFIWLEIWVVVLKVVLELGYCLNVNV